MATFVGTAGFASTTTSGTFQINFPTGWAAGDFAIFSWYEGTSGTAKLPSGWTVIREADVAGDPHHVLICYRVLQTGDTAPTLTLTAKMAYLCSAWRPGAGNTLALDTTQAATDLTTAATTITPPALTAASGTAGSVSVISIGGREAAAVATAVTTTPATGWTEPSGGDTSTAAGTTTALRQVFVEHEYKLAATGTQTPGVVTASQSSFLSAQHILIKELAPAVTVPSGWGIINS